MKKIRRIRLRLLPGLLCLAGCCTDPPHAATPALHQQPSQTQRAELSRLIGEALRRPPILLAPDALTHEPSVVIEPMHPRDSSGLPLQGRSLGRPEIFRLMLEGSHCLLLQESTGRRWRLHASCIALRLQAAPQS